MFELDRTLFKFSAQTPAIAAFVQLPPEITQSMLSPRRIRRLTPLNVFAHGHLAMDFLIDPSPNHSAQLINQAQDYQVAPVSWC